MPSPQGKPGKNQLLGALSAQDREHLLAHCEQVELSFAAELYLPGQRIQQVYFPIDGFISLITPLQGHTGLEIGLVGHEGMLGISTILGVEASQLRAVVQGKGLAWAMPTARLSRQIIQSAMLRQTLNRYLYVILAQIAQTAACTRFHLVPARLARWLLMTRDRARADDFHITHEFLAYMLGVRRSGITQAATALQKRKLIHYSRGNIEILDSSGLEAAACGCYATDKATYTTVLG